MNAGKTFFAFRHRDAADAYIDALVNAGYREIRNANQADFILYDHEERLGAFKNAIKGKPAFIYPHTPYSWFIWDGLAHPHEVACNFVYGENAKLGLESIGYKSRVEVCGFARCEVLPFRPSKGLKLLFAPAHPLKDGKFPNPKDYETHRYVFDWIVRHADYFDGVTVRIFGTIHENGFYGTSRVKFEDASISGRYGQALTVADSVRSIEAHDIIISCNTFGYLSLARGKPTIMYGNCSPRTREGGVGHYHLYQHLIDFPRPLESMTIEEVIDARDTMDSSVAEWVKKTIGGNFDAEKFISIVKESL